MKDKNRNSHPGRFKRFRAWLFSWRILRRTLLTLAVFATLIAVGYTVENWRGQRAWEKCKRDLTAAGYELDWNKLIPPPIPDEQNIFKAPNMQEWFARQALFSVAGQTGQPATNFLQKLIQHPSLSFFGKESRITNAITAKEFLDASEQFAAEFALIRTALSRPYARMDGDYSKPFEMPIPNFVALRTLAQTFAQRAHCHLLLNQPEDALTDLTFIHATRKLLLGQPTGKPMTLVAAMIHVAITGLYTSIIEEGLHGHLWQEPQLLALESQLAELSLTIPAYEGLRCELTATSHVFEHEPFHKLLAMSLVVRKSPEQRGGLAALWDRIKGLKLRLYDCAPRGWLLQNLVVHTRLEEMILESIRGLETNIHPQGIEIVQHKLESELERISLFNLIANVAIPSTSRAIQTTVKNQTAVNQARIACALERYRQTHGQYPDSLTALQPQFLRAIPNDLIGNQPLKYRRAANDDFILYSVAWNETDDGGVTAHAVENGDWVWTSAAK